jgi:hypothetical protein
MQSTEQRTSYSTSDDDDAAVAAAAVAAAAAADDDDADDDDDEATADDEREAECGSHSGFDDGTTAASKTTRSCREKGVSV